jgi:hypothetical protein
MTGSDDLGLNRGEAKGKVQPDVRTTGRLERARLEPRRESLTDASPPKQSLATADFLPVMNEPQAVSGPAFAAIQRPPNTSLYFLQQVGGRRRRIFADFALFLAQFVKEPVEGLRHHLVADVPVLISGEGNGFVLRDQRVVLLGDAVSGHRILHHGAERGRELGRGLVLD